MSKHWKRIKNLCSEMPRMGLEVNMNVVVESLRNPYKTLIIQTPEILLSYKKFVYETQDPS